MPNRWAGARQRHCQYIRCRRYRYGLDLIVILHIAHQFHRRIWQAVYCPSVPPSRLVSRSLPISSTVAFGWLHIGHHRDGHVWLAVYGLSAPPSRWECCVSPTTSTLAFGTLPIDHHTAIAFGTPQMAHHPAGCDCSAAYRSSYCWARLAGCILLIILLGAFGRLFVNHHLHRRVWNADPRSSGKRHANGQGRSRIAQRARMVLLTRAFVAAR